MSDQEARDDLADLLADAIGYGLVPLSIRDHPEITAEFRTIEDRDGLIERITEALIAAGWRPPVGAPEPGRRATVKLFKPSGKYYTTESWEVPVGAIGPYDMENSPDFHRIDGTGAVLVCSEGELSGDENWGFPHLFPGTPEEER